MAINKNFVIKNGIEVNDNVFVVDPDINKVGINTAIPEYELHVIGGIGVTDARVTGVTTALGDVLVANSSGVDGKAFAVRVSAGNSVGINTANPRYPLEIIGPASSGQVAEYVFGDLEITGDITSANINSGSANFTGVTTFTDTTQNTLGNADTGAVQIDGGLGVNKNVTVGGQLRVTGDSFFVGVVTFAAGASGTIQLGDNANDNVEFQADVNSNIIPNTTSTFNLGSDSQEWRDLHLAGNAGIGSLSVTGISTFAGDVSIADKIVHTGDTDTAIRFPADDTFSVETGGAEAYRIDSSGRLLVGSSTARANFYNQSSSNSTRFQVEGTSFTSSSASFIRNSDNASDAEIVIAKSRGGTVGSNTIVQSGDDFGAISFQGSDGVEFVEGAAILAQSDGTPGSNDMPGRLVFKTTNGGASSPTERLRITSDGLVGIGTDNPGYEFHVKGTGTVAYFEGTGGNSFIGFEDADDSTIAFVGVDGGNLKFQTSGNSFSDKLIITPAGLVGIGSTIPAGKFDVVGHTELDTLNVAGVSTFVGVSSFTNTTNNTLGDVDTGSVKFDGGLGIAGNVTVGGGLSVTGNSYFVGMVTFAAGTDGNITLGDTNTDNVVFVADVDSNIVPNTDNAYDLGSSSQQWKDLYVNGLAELDFVNVSAASTFAGDVSIADKIVHTGDTNTAIRFPANDTVTVETAGSERLRITSAGSVGINTAAGASVGLNLHQISGAAAQVRFQGSATGTGEVDGFGLGNSGTVDAYVWNYEAGHIQFATSNTERLRITSGGSVGIGTTNPEKTLTVHGDSSSSIRISKSGVLAYDHTFDGSSYTIANNNLSAGIPIILGTKTSGAESVRITSGGSVGIGTTNPQTQLHVAGDSFFVGDVGIGGTISNSPIVNIDAIGDILLNYNTNQQQGIALLASTSGYGGKSTVQVYGAGSSSEEAFEVYNGAAGAHVAKITHDGSATFANVNVGGGLSVTGNSYFVGMVTFAAGTNGNITLGDSAGDNVVFNADVNSNFIPNTNNAYDLGSSSQQWKDLYIDGTANIDSLSADSAAIGDLTDNRVVIAGTGGELEDSANLTFDGNSLGIGTDLTVSGISTFTGNIDANGNLDVDGYTELDDLNVAGVSTFAGLIDANGRIVGAATSNVIPFLYSNFSDLPSASTYHGAFAHVHATGKAYYAHANAWYELVNKNLAGIVGTGTEGYNVGVVTATNIDLNGDIDVDGHTELDNLNVSGISTFAQTNITNIDVTGITTTQILYVGAGGSTLTVDANNATFAIGSAATTVTATMNGGAIPSIGLVIALGG